MVPSAATKRFRNRIKRIFVENSEARASCRMNGDALTDKAAWRRSSASLESLCTDLNQAGPRLP
jgi:hypothetical protein